MTNKYNIYTIMAELNVAANQVVDEQLEQLAEAIIDSGRIFVAGAGRSGLMMRSFAMRLMHLGLDVYVVGETVTRSIAKGDLLLIGTGSGETRSLIPMAEKAISLEAKVATLTLSSSSAIGRLANLIVQLPGAPKNQLDQEVSTIQPMGSLFEQVLLLVCDAVILKLMQKQTSSGRTMYGNHANLE
ncbi:6-phospho-3-hexuloisomerase [Paenibacillus endoradicis]|uniref:6-phospho-3-hexuloisomerase n=1 Tax=Paenibacillus endoradicis TaxID=2972487 RepID=UPI0021590C1C|nr:6-phospho-3-hexuloisomerase [Paenibacillus endoradicis]MCR8658756.1 6-phospho-3-hexuloisomerase [Paenibacillus endoradicis]